MRPRGSAHLAAIHTEVTMLNLDERRVPATRQENENLSSTARGLDVLQTAPLIFLCECDNPFCTEWVKLTLKEYDRTRRRQGPILHPDHQGAAAGDRGKAA
jgi:hypothetical protein